MNDPDREKALAAAASDLNNLLQIISGAVGSLEEVCRELPAAGKPLAILRSSVDRAAHVTEQLAGEVGGTEEKILLHPAFVPAAQKRRTPTLQVAHRVLVVDDEPLARERMLRLLAGARDVEVVANGYDETALRAASDAERAAARKRLGIPDGAYVAAFVGGDWEPNHEAVAWLVEQVLPRLAGEDVVLLVVGAVAARLGDRREPWLRAHAETPDLAALLAAADAGLNPVASGGGSNVKVPT